MKKIIISVFLAPFWFLAVEAATAQTYNGPVSFTYSGTAYNIYYYTGLYSTLYSFLNTGNVANPGGGLPPNQSWPLMPWYGNQTATDQFVTAWQNATNRGGGVQYPNPYPGGGSLGPYFAFQNNSGNGEVNSRYWEQSSGTIKSLTTDDLETHSYAVVTLAPVSQ